MKVRATHFAEDIAKVNWQGIPADMKDEAMQIKDVAAQFYKDGGDIAKGIDLYVAALNKKLSEATPKKKVPFSMDEMKALKKGLKAMPGSPKHQEAVRELKKAQSKKKVTDSEKTKKQKQIEEAKRANEQMLNQAGLGEFSKFSRAQILEHAQLFHKRRRMSAQILDEAVDHKKRLTPTPENLVRWMKDPGKFDLIGIDTFEKGNPTADLKIKKEIFWHRLLKK